MLQSSSPGAHRYSRCLSLARTAIHPRRCTRSHFIAPEKLVKLSICSCVVALCLAFAVGVVDANAQSADVVLHTSRARAFGTWSLVADSTAADGKRLANPDRGAAKLLTPKAQPTKF